MFKRFAADALGLSDIGSVIKPADYDKVESDDYVMHEDEEKIFFLIKSKTDEYCFTNKALIHVDGTSAMSKKRTLRRFDYVNYLIQNAALETAGTVDLDIELMFSMGQHNYTISVNKKFVEEVKDLYKALIKIGLIQHENSKMLQYAQKSVELASTTVHRSSSTAPMEAQFNAINESAFNWLAQSYENYMVKDFGSVFEKFIKN